MKTNTLDLSTIEKVTNIIHKLNFNQNKLLAFTTDIINVNTLDWKICDYVHSLHFRIFSAVKCLCVFYFEHRVSIFWRYFNQLYFWKGERADLILKLQLFLNCVYLISFRFGFPNYNTTFSLFIANEKISKEEQLWTAVILSNK